MAISDMIPGVPTLKIFGVGLTTAVAAVSLTVLFYEGIPLGSLRHVPLVGPGLAFVLDGRVDRQRKAGAAAERQLWEEARRKLLARQDEDRRKAQDRIDEAEQRYLDAVSAHDETRAALQAAIEQSESDDAANSAATRGPAISRGVSRALDKVGR